MRCGVSFLVIGALALGSSACGDDGGAAPAVTAPTTALPITDEPRGEPRGEAGGSGAAGGREAAQAVVAAPTTARATSTTSRPTTSTATTRPSTTVGRTTVETLAPTTLPLPMPAPPPAPRADEPYIELGTIEIPRIGISETLLEGITLNTLDLAPGHWPGTAMPGQVGNVVIAGHRTSHEKPFRNIDQLQVGDEVVLTTPAGRFVYAVTGTTVVAPDAMYIIEQTSAATATLFACHPPGSTRQRIVVSLALQR